MGYPMKEIMEEYSNTFIKCVKDWPEDLQEDIFKLYAYLRVCDEMLVKIEGKDYGFCDTCGIEIGLKRLEARPTATLCIDCKTLAEIRERQMAR